MTKNNISSLGEYFADIITSKHNQHVIILIVGAAGTGKSWAAMSLATEISKCVSEKKGGQPSDYYNFENCLAVMSKDEVKRVMANPGMYNVIHIDDAGVPLNARKYMSDDNIDFNAVLQTFRPNHNAVIVTAQAGFLLDKVIRSIAHYIIEMEQSNFDLGISIAKCKRVVYNHQKERPFYPFVMIENTTYKRHIFEKPSDDMAEEYERIRAEQLKKLHEKEEEPSVIVTDKRPLWETLGDRLEYLFTKYGSWPKVAEIISDIKGESISSEGCRKAYMKYKQQLIMCNTI